MTEGITHARLDHQQLVRNLTTTRSRHPRLR
jgi:hypothetical protein